MLTQTQGYRISPIQRRLWTLLTAGDGVDYRIQVVVRLQGVTNRELLVRAIEIVKGRHEALRMSLQCLTGISLPVQIVEETSTVDITEYPPAESEVPNVCSQKASSDTSSPAPALNLSLQRVSETCHLLRMSAPAVCMDFNSMQLVVAEIAAVYSVLGAGTSDLLDPVDPVLQYPDVSEWLNEINGAAESAIGKKYWRRIATETRSAIASAGNVVPSPAVLPVPLSNETQARIAKGEVRGLWKTPEFVLAVWIVVLVRLGYETDAVAALFNGRSDERLQGVLGPLARYLPVIVKPGPASTVMDIVRKVREETEKTAKWQDYFAWEIFQTEEIGNARSKFIFGFECLSLDKYQAGPALNLAIEELGGHIDALGIRLSCRDRQGKLVLNLECLDDSFALHEMKTIASCLGAAIKHAATSPEVSVYALNILDETETRLLEEFNRRSAQVVVDLFVHEQFSAQAKKTPAAVAVSFEGNTITYAELHQRAHRVACGLRSRGVHEETLVGLCFDRSLEMVVGILGVLMAGGAYVPLDPDYPVGRLAYMLKASGATLVLTAEKVAPKLAQVTAAVLTLQDTEGENISGTALPGRVDRTIRHM